MCSQNDLFQGREADTKYCCTFIYWTLSRILILVSSLEQEVIVVQPIVQAFRPAKRAALPSFHALTGAAITGSFSGKGKGPCWKVFEEASDSILKALCNLGKEQQRGNEQFICQLYQPKSDITTFKVLMQMVHFSKESSRIQEIVSNTSSLGTSQHISNPSKAMILSVMNAILAIASVEKPEKSRISTGFEPLTWRYRFDAPTN